MGCFGFTYADTGENIVSCTHGYIYITKFFQKRINYNKSALKFDYVDSYGNFDIINKHKDIIRIDYYALMAAQFYVESLFVHKNLSVHQTEMLDAFIILLNKAINGESYNHEKFKTAMNEIRDLAIDYTLRANYFTKTDNKTYRLPKLSNQSEKDVIYNKICKTKVPMLITKKRLENIQPDDVSLKIVKSYDLYEIAMKWGMVSGNDPAQGFYVSHDNWIKYIYTNNK